jgi:ABC-2 type transport system permease protein
MLLRNIFLKTIRDNRAGAFGWGIGLGVIMIVGAASYAEIINSVGPDRAKVIGEATKLLQSFSFLLGEVTDISTIGGFMTVRILGFIPLVTGLWAAVAAIGAIRGEEQTGALDLVLSTPHTRSSVLRDKALGLFVSLSLLVLLAWLGLWAGIAAAGQAAGVSVANLLEVLANLLVISAFWCVAGLLISQFVAVRRTASSIAGAFIFGTYLLDNLFTTNPSLGWLAWLMPFHYSSASKPLAPSRTMEWGAWLILVAITTAITFMTGYLFSRRDLGSTFHFGRRRAEIRQITKKSGSAWLLGSLFGKSIRDLVWPTLLWGVGLGIYAVMIVATTKSTLEPMQEVLKNLGWIALIVGNLATPEGYLSYSLFTFMPIVLAAYAIFQVSGWADDEEEGRMETLTSMPFPRWRLLLARYAAFVLSLAAVLLIIGLFIWLASVATDTPVAGDRLLAALVGILPTTLLIAAIGLCLATWLKRPSAAVPITIAVAVVMFLLDLFGPALNLPDAILNLSIFHLYGRPLLEGIKWGGLLALVGAALVLGVGSLVGFMRRDIAK